MNESVCFLNIQDERWIKFVRSHPNATIFHHHCWSLLLEKCYGYHSLVLAVVGEKGQLKAGLPLMKIDNILKGKRWVSLPFTDYFHPLSVDENALVTLTNGLVEITRSKQMSRIEIRWTLLEHEAISSSTDFVIHTLLLESDPSQLLRRMKKGHRYNIRKSENDKLTLKRSMAKSDIDKFYWLHLSTRQRLGYPVQPKRFFNLIWKLVIRPGNGFILLVWFKNEPIAGALFLTYRETITYKFSASNENYWSLYPNNLLLWEAIKWGCENGYRVFDFGNSPIRNQGLRNFKSGWGAQEFPLSYSHIGYSPSSHNPSLLEKTVNEIIQHSNPIVCRVAGELFYKYLG